MCEQSYIHATITMEIEIKLRNIDLQPYKLMPATLNDPHVHSEYNTAHT